MKRLCLVYPNQRWLKDDANTVWDLNPVTLCLLATMVKDLVEIKIIDAQFYNMTQEDFQEELKLFSPDFIGISILSSEYEETLNITLDIAKHLNENIITIAGGVHITTKYQYAFKNKNLDFGVYGEGEYTLRNLLLYLLNKADFPKEGLIYKDDNKLVVQKQVLVEDLESLPWVDYSFIKLEDYLNRGARIGPNRPPALPTYRMITTRGCPFGCSFCQVETISGKKVRARDPEDVVNELLFLKEKHGLKSITFEDDNLLMAQGTRYARKLFSAMIEKKLDLPWIAGAFAIWLMDDEMLDLMKESGCVGVNIAVESGNERVVKEIVKKPIKNLKKIPERIKAIRERKMYCIVNFIIGFPSETWDEIRETIQYAENCGADYVKFFVAVPLIGTELYDIAIKNDALIHSEEYPITDWRYSQIKSEEWSAKDISILRAYEWDRINFSPEKIENIAKLWGVSVDKLQEIRKNTRDALEF